jgi:Barstar (barnase inhibitor)
VDDLPADPEQAAARGWLSLVVDLHDITDKAGLLDRFAEAGAFPDWWGVNWDALADLLRDLSWLGPAAGYLIVLDGREGFSTRAPEAAAVLDAVLSQAGEAWAAAGTPFVTLGR